MGGAPTGCFSAAAGFDWDSNVTLQPGDPVSAQLVSGAGDLVYTQLANLEYNLVPSGPWGLWGMYSYSQNFHRRLTKFDMWSNTLGLTPMYTWTNSRFWMLFTYNYTDVESDKYYTAFTLTPSFLYLIGQKWGIEANLRLARQYYWFPISFQQDDPSGRNLASSLAGDYFFKNQQGFIQLRFTYEHFFTSGSNWENNTGGHPAWLEDPVPPRRSYGPSHSRWGTPGSRPRVIAGGSWRCGSSHLQFRAGGMAVGLGGVEALDLGDAGRVIPAMLDPGGVFKDVGPFGELIDEEVAGGVAGGLVVGETILCAVAGEDVDWFGAAAPLVLEVHILHIAVSAELDTDDQFTPTATGPTTGSRVGPWGLFRFT